MIFDHRLITLKTAQHMKNLQKPQYLLWFLMIFHILLALRLWLNKQAKISNADTKKQ